jgi:hypothetical protein
MLLSTCPEVAPNDDDDTHHRARFDYSLLEIGMAAISEARVYSASW